MPTSPATATPPPDWPPPGFPLVQGDYALTDAWSIHLPEPFARRIEDGALVLWRPGLTIWLIAWRNDKHQPQSDRLAWIREFASPSRSSERVSAADGLTRFSYRLRDENEDGSVESLNAYVIADDGHLQLSIYFDDADNDAKARQLVDNVRLK